jgi:hypothetical protein
MVMIEAIFIGTLTVVGLGALGTHVLINYLLFPLDREPTPFEKRLQDVKERRRVGSLDHHTNNEWLGVYEREKRALKQFGR